jgi:CHASE2 domain-containing sensor protein
MAETARTENVKGSRPWLTVFAGALWAGLVAFGLVSLSREDYLPEGPDEWTYDWRTLFFSKTADRARKDIAIIVVDEQSMADYDYVSPVDRGLMATLLRGIDGAGPKAIGLDFIYDRKSEEDKTQELIDAMKSVRAPLVFGAIDLRVRGFRDENLKYQEEFIARTGRDAGHVFFARATEKLKIGDQVVRFMGDRSVTPPNRDSFAPLIAQKAGGVRAEPASAYISWLLPPPGADLFPLFRVPRHQPGSSADAILPPSWRPVLKDRIVLVGGDFVDRDKHLTPLSISDGARMPGVMVQAQLLAQLLDGRSLRTFPYYYEMTVLGMVCFLGFLFSRRWQIKRYDLLLYIAGIGVLVALGIVLFSVFNVIAPSTTLFFAWTFGVTGGHYASKMLNGRPSASSGAV